MALLNHIKQIFGYHLYKKWAIRKIERNIGESHGN